MTNDGLPHLINVRLAGGLTHSLTYKPLHSLLQHIFTLLSSSLSSPLLHSSEIYLASSTGVILHSVDSGTYASANADVAVSRVVTASIFSLNIRLFIYLLCLFYESYLHTLTMPCFTMLYHAMLYHALSVIFIVM